MEETKFGTFSHSKQHTDNQPFKFYPHVKISVLIIVWFFSNVMYNLDNKVALNMLPLPWIVGVFQVTVGIFIILPIWIFKIWPFPSCHSYNIMISTFVPLAICHLFVHLGAVISMEQGAVSFTHIVKAGEPVMTAMFSAILQNVFYSWQTYLSLIPVISGVALASAKELSFTWNSFGYAMLSNIGAAGRTVTSKSIMDNPSASGFYLTSGNQYALITIFASLISIPLAIFIEGPRFYEIWEKSVGIDSNFTPTMILVKMISSSIWYHLYNLVAFYCLEDLSPVTHSVVNTIKRVVIVVSSILFFKTAVTLLGAVGSSIAIIGACVYGLIKNKYK